VLRQASLGALPESTQLTGCAEGRELLTLFLTRNWHPSWSPSYQTQQRWPQRKLWPFLSSLDSCPRNDRYLCRTCRGCCPDAFCARQQLASRPYQACWLGPVWNRTRTGCWSPLMSQRSWRSWRGFQSWISPDRSWMSCLRSWRTWLGSRWTGSLSYERSRLCAPNSARRSLDKGP